MPAVEGNSKTYRSVDLTTICPNRCEYCYVRNARESGSFMAKSLVPRRTYGGEILRWRDQTITKLNKMGGLRIFSFADYLPWMDGDLNQLIEDAEERRLLLKAITKNKTFVKKYKDKILINYSVDLVHNFEFIPELRHPNVKLRCMVRNEDDVKEVYDVVDILTPYHGPKINEHYRPKEAREAAIDYAPEKTCCTTHNCGTCEVRCGQPADKIKEILNGNNEDS